MALLAVLVLIVVAALAVALVLYRRHARTLRHRANFGASIARVGVRSVAHRAGQLLGGERTLESERAWRWLAHDAYWLALCVRKLSSLVCARGHHARDPSWMERRWLRQRVDELLRQWDGFLELNVYANELASSSEEQNRLRDMAPLFSKEWILLITLDALVEELISRGRLTPPPAEACAGCGCVHERDRRSEAFDEPPPSVHWVRATPCDHWICWECLASRAGAAADGAQSESAAAAVADAMGMRKLACPRCGVPIADYDDFFQRGRKAVPAPAPAAEGQEGGTAEEGATAVA